MSSMTVCQSRLARLCVSLSLITIGCGEASKPLNRTLGTEAHHLSARTDEAESSSAQRTDSTRTRTTRTRDLNGEPADERDGGAEQTAEVHRAQEHDDDNHRHHSHTDDRNDVAERTGFRTKPSAQRQRITQRTQKAMAMLNALGRHGGRMHRALGLRAT